MVRPASGLLLGLFGLVLAASATAAPPALEPPPDAVVEEARTLVAAMKAAERGPYTRLRWYCNDGSVLPPEPYACRERGGGRQHGEYSPARQRLAQLGWSVGTIFAALSWEELWDGERRHQRLRELPLERFLVEVDDGWVLRRARTYRGRVQIEDEETAGRSLLVRLLSQPRWTAENFLLAREAVRTVPHHGGADRTRSVRRLSQEVAEADRSFEPLRVKIHSSPGAEDIQATRRWIEAARRRGAAPATIALAERLAQELDGLYGDADDWRGRALRSVAGTAWEPRLRPALELPRTAPPSERLARFAQLLAGIREGVEEAGDGARKLALLDLSIVLEREVLRAGFERLRQPLERSELLEASLRLADAAFGAGLLSPGERATLAERLTPLTKLAQVDTVGYVAAVRTLRRAASWALATVRYTFAEALARYTPLEPAAARFPDELLRGSAMLPLAEATTRLAADADGLSGISHRLFGRSYAGLLALNPGVARGPLRVVDPEWAGRGGVAREEIVVLPQTVSELDPVAGILSLGEGNLLSHIQLLARNLGIPNATVSAVAAPALTARAGETVLLAVGTDGSIVVEAWDELPPAIRDRIGGAQSERQKSAVKVAAPTPDLGVRRLLGLEELRSALAGRVVGPKAANLGELAALFPGRVEQALALPFGIFAAHVATGPGSPKARLDQAFADHRAGRLDDAGLAAEIEAVRAAIGALTLSDDLRGRLEAELGRRFGPPGSYGVFVRSDTNVEDLPGFTGAGLNLTVPHVVGLERLLAAIPRVWSSVLAPRAVSWRSTILERPEEVYSSVLLMKSVSAEKSGVLVTADLVDRGAGLTVATAWGVGGAVDGEAAETLVLLPGGGERLIGEAKAPYRRRLKEDGGVEWVPSPAGPVLTAAERQALRDLAAEVETRLTAVPGVDGDPQPWDIEFGFVEGRLALFQIRPLVERGQRLADRVVDALGGERGAAPATVRLDAVAEEAR